MRCWDLRVSLVFTPVFCRRSDPLVSSVSREFVLEVRGAPNGRGGEGASWSAREVFIAVLNVH